MNAGSLYPLWEFTCCDLVRIEINSHYWCRSFRCENLAAIYFSSASVVSHQQAGMSAWSGMAASD
uniref:Uncharacterized protein n=1 Tax=Anguilla anguilla TaxID=7936 RepID=A0A0E9THE3_ANGAN